MNDRAHEEYRELIASYVLNALSPGEMQEIGRHIASCEECMREADSYSGVTSALTQAVDPVPLPQGFTDRVVAAGVGDPRSRTASKPRRSPFERWRRLAPVLALVLVAAVVAVGVIDARRDADRQEQVDRLIAQSGGMEMHGRGGATARLLPRDDGFAFAARNLDAPPEGKTYQLWFIDGEREESAGTFGVEDGQALVFDDTSLEGVDAVAVTVEPKGGSRKPTSSPVISSA
ncbi:MAG: anti-sigma factor [Actinobacteria bacterium]|nr:anti-sigma factor [Actinomycetota bacterium]